MSIKETKESNIIYMSGVVESHLNNVLKDPNLNMPEEVKNKVNSFIDELKLMQLESKTKDFKIINGKMLNEKEILKIIKNASSNKNWDSGDSEILENKDVKDLKNTYGIDFKESEISKHHFYISTRDRNAVSFISVVSLPGFVKVYLRTDKIYYSIDDLLNNEDLFDKLVGEL